MTTTKLATFKISPDRWGAFLARATEKGTNASALLKLFVDNYLEGLYDPLAMQTAQEVQGIDSLIDKRLAPIHRELEDLREKC